MYNIFIIISNLKIFVDNQTCKNLYSCCVTRFSAQFLVRVTKPLTIQIFWVKEKLPFYPNLHAYVHFSQLLFAHTTPPVLFSLESLELYFLFQPLPEAITSALKGCESSNCMLTKQVNDQKNITGSTQLNWE